MDAIQPENIGGHKLFIHQEYLRKWLQAENLDKKYPFEEIWHMREEWIYSLNR